MSRSRTSWGALAGTGIILLLAGGIWVWPRLAVEHQRAVETARTMASGIVPANAVDQARVETRPTSYGWRVVFRDVQVACSRTGFRCSPTAADVAAGGSDPLFRDVLVCVEYGTARGFFIAGMVRPVATVSWRDPGGAGCMRSKLPSPPSAP